MYENTYVGAWELAGDRRIISGKPKACPGYVDPTPTPDPNATPTPTPTVTPTPTPTPEAGDPGSCTPVDETAFDRIWSYTNAVVKGQIKAANSLAAQGKWKPRPIQRLFVFNRGSKVLRSMRSLLNRYDNTLTCPALAPTSCTTEPVDKGAIRALFNKLYVGTLPQLQALDRSSNEQKAGLEELIAELPDNVNSCDSGVSRRQRKGR